MILQPGNSFTIVRQIENHLDAATYYVQAVIRNAYTDAIIDTVQLTGRGGQRFSKNWQVPADASGQGFYVSIVTSVYTDSAYTTKSENYGDQEQTYLVQDRVIMRGGGGLDAFTVKRIVEKAIADIPKPDPVEIPEPKEPVDRTDEILRALAEVKAAIPPPVTIPESDFSPMLKAIGRVEKAVQEKPVTPATDLKPVLTAIDNTQGVLMHLLQGVGDSMVQMAKNVLTTELGKMKWTSTFVTNAQKGETPPLEAAPSTEKPIPFDVTKLAG